jgi:transcriptional regulator with GAF, ATPase, and Fis domain
MTIDAQYFFHEATLRICGSLDIEKAFGDFFSYVQDYIPVEEAYLHYYLPEIGASRFFVKADTDGGRLINVVAVWPDPLRKLVEADNFCRPFVSNRAEDNPMSRPMLKVLGKSKSSLMTLRLTMEKEWVGGVSLWAGTWDRFSSHDVQLLEGLREPLTIALSNYRRFREIVTLKDRLAEDYRRLKEELTGTDDETVIGADLGLKGVMEMVRQVAPHDSPALIIGETGTGKELITRAIHYRSRRRENAFVKVNCGAIAHSLLDSELFGHEKGAFTGAIMLKRGRFERAHGGTLFLDEVGELPLEAQVKLLRVLQEKEFERVGGTNSIPADVRLIAATNRNLEAMAESGGFRRDLYFRLQVFPITVPPLRERMCDLPALVHHFVHKKSMEMQRPEIPVLAPGALDALMAYHWPGNVRELENVVERALILCRGDQLTFPDLQEPVSRKTDVNVMNNGRDLSDLETVIREHIKKALKKAEGKIEGRHGAAEILGVNPGTLRHRMRKLNIPFGRKANSESRNM